MPHLKKPQTNWLDAAWEISAELTNVTSVEPKNRLAEFLSENPNKDKAQPFSEDVIDTIEILLMKITLSLAYRLQVYHKAHKKLSHRPIDLYNRDPRVTLKAIKKIELGGVVLDTSDFSAFDAHIKLCHILIDGYVCHEWKRTLPLLVASIGGVTTSQAATLKATQPRARKPNYLKSQKLRALELHPNFTWKELLKKLSFLNIVTSSDDAFVFWEDEEGRRKSTALATFQKWKPD